MPAEVAASRGGRPARVERDEHGPLEFRQQRWLAGLAGAQVVVCGLNVAGQDGAVRLYWVVGLLCWLALGLLWWRRAPGARLLGDGTVERRSLLGRTRRAGAPEVEDVVLAYRDQLTLVLGDGQELGLITQEQRDRVRVERWVRRHARPT